MTFNVWKTKKGQWRWHLKAVNGKKIATSGESYKRRVDCLAAISLVKKASLARVI